MSFSSTGLPKGKRMHQCDFCDRFFSTASNMREHRRTHTGEKPFTCRYCGKAFAQSSTHSKHLLVHKSEEKLSRGRSVKQINRQRQGGDLSEPCLTKPAVSSTSQFRTEPSLLPSKTFIKTLQEHKQSQMKTEVDFFDNSDWRNSNSVLGRQVDTSLPFKNTRDAVITPPSSFNNAKDDKQRSFAEQKPIITGMFKNRACQFSPSVESRNLQVKQETLEVKEINFETSSFLTEPGSSGNKDPIQYEKVKNKTLEAAPLSFREAKTIHCDDSKAIHSALPQPALSKGINRDDHATWNGSLEGTSIIQLDLTSDGDTRPAETLDRFQSNIETFFKCIHCSETFSSLEEHICLAKEAKMFFKCQVCQKTFAQYGPFFRHKQSHESSKQFAVGSSLSDISTYKAEEYKKCDSTMADNIQKESSDVSQITDGLHLRQAKEDPTVDLLASCLPSESSRIQSSTQLREEEQNSNDDVIIIEEYTAPAQDRCKDVLENLVSVEKPREQLSAISTYANTDQFNNIEGRYFERSNLSTDDVGKRQRRALISEPLLKPNVVEKKPGTISRLGKRQAYLKKYPQQIGKKVYPFTCLFCPRKFSTASNMREHMRIHTGEKPFSCELCHKKFAQSSTRSKHMQTHTGYKMQTHTGYKMSGCHLYGKKFTQTKTYKKHLRKPGKHHENPKSFLPNRPLNIKEKPKVHPLKSSSMKALGNKSYASLPYSKANRPSLKKYAFRMLPEPSNNFSFPPKTENNEIPSLTAKPYSRDDANNGNLFGYNKEGTNRMNVSHEKTDCIVPRNNNQDLKNKLSFPLAACSDSHISVFGSSFENSKTQTNHLLPSTTSTVFPRPKSRHRGAHRLLRNARSYRPFRCTYCPRTFSTSGNMKEHMRTHTGEKPFRCEYCHRRFAQSSTHSKHVQIHIRKQQLNCFFCGRFFSQVALLRSHIVTDHKAAAAQNSTRNNNNNNLSANLCKSSNLETVNKSGTGFSFGSNGQSESFLDSVEKNRCSQEAKVKENTIIEIPNSNLENVGNYEVNSSLREKRLLEADLPANHTGFLGHEKNESFLPLRESEENTTFPEKNECKRDSAEIPKIGKDTQENLKLCVAEDSLISKSNLSSCIAEAATHQLDSEMFGELLTSRAWLATSANARIQHHHQSQIKSGSPSALELTQIKANNSELSSIIELESSKSLAKDANFYSEIKPLDSSSSVDDSNARKSFSLEEELNECTGSAEQMRDTIFLNDYCYQDQLMNLSANEILESCTDSQQKRPTKLQIGSPQNINEDNLMPYAQTLGNLGVELQAKRNTATDQPSDQYVQSKVGMYNSFLDKGKTMHQQKVYSPFLHSDQLLSPSSFSGHFTPPALTNNSPVDHLPTNVQISTINKVRNEALRSLSNEQESNTFVSSRVTSCEQSLSSLGSKISFELASHQVEQSLDLSGNVSDHKAREQNVPPLLNSDHSLNPCSGDSTKKLNVNWLLDIVPQTKSDREEITSDFVENCNSKILNSKMENSLQEGSVAVFSNGIKLEKNVLSVDTEQGYVAKDAQVENVTNSDLTKAASVSDSLDSGFHFNISNIAANVQYSVRTETNRNKIIADNSRPFCDKVETISLSDEAASDTSLARICSLESTSVCTDTENQQLPLNGMPPNNVETSSMAHLERKRKNLQRYKMVGKFKCIYCNRCFSSRSNMREHMRIHTGEKPFECVFCFRRFAQSSTHSKHVQTHLRFRQLVCPQCGRRFHRPNNLCQHIKTHHRISHTSTSLAKKRPLRLEPAPPTAHASSPQIKQSSNNKDKHLYSADSKENNRQAINVHEASIESSEIYRQTKTNNGAVDSIPEHFVDQQGHLPFLNDRQTNKEISNDLSKIPNELITSKDEKTESTTDTDFTIDINFPTPNKTTGSLQDVSFDAINSHLDQSDFPLNKFTNALPERNNNATFSSEHPIPNPIQTLNIKSNLQKPSDASSDKKSSHCNIYQQTVAPSNTVCKSEKAVCKKSDIHESNSHTFSNFHKGLLEVSGNSNFCKTPSPRLEFKCEICPEEFPSDKLLNLHQQYHIVNLAKSRGFDLNVGELEHSINFRNFLRENKIKSLDELEESFEKVAADLGLEKLLEKSCQVQQEESLSQKIANKELCQNTGSIIRQAEKNDFNPSHIVCKPSSNLPSSHLSSSCSSFSSLPSSSSSVVCPVSVTEPTKVQKKKCLMLHFHRCLFCSKMFDALINLQEHLRTHVDEGPSLQSKYNRKLKECRTWYKHVEIVLGGKLRLPTRTFVGNAQHLKIMFDVGERLKMLSHRNLYKCRQCPKECTTYQSLLFHRQTHLRKLTGQKIPTLASGKLAKRAHGPSSFLQKRPTSSLIFSLEHISSDNEGNPSTVENRPESKASLPLLGFSLNNQFWLLNLNGKLRALGSYSQCLPVDKSPMTEMVSRKQNHLWNVADSQQQKPNETFNISLEEGENADPTNKGENADPTNKGENADPTNKGENADPTNKGENADSTNKCNSEDKLEWPMHFSLNNLEDNYTKIDLNDDDSKKKEEVLPSRSILSPDVNNSGVIKPFGQEVTTMVSLQLQKCVDCGKMFTNVGHLEKHLQIHTGKLSFQCHFCPKSFTNFGSFSRHKNLIHLRQNQKSCIPSCRNNKSSSNDDSKPGLQESVESNFHQTKPQPTLDMNLADVDSAYIADLVKKVLGSKRGAVFSDSPFVHRLPNEESTTLSEMIEYPPRLSEKQPTESSINLSSEPLQSQESNLNVCVIEKFQSLNKESADEINFVEGEASNKTVRSICATDNFPTEVQVKNEAEEHFSSLNNLKAVYKSNTSVKRKTDIFSHDWQKGEVGSKEETFPSQSSNNSERQVDSKHDSDKEAQINYRGDSNRGFDEKHLKEDAPVECIFIHDDPDDHSPGECCILDVGSSPNQYLLNRNEKTDTTSEIIIVSDEENDDNSTQVEMQSFDDRNSLIKHCDNTDDAFLSRLKENQIEDRPKADCKLFQDVYKLVGMSFKNCKSSFPEITGQKPSPNLNDCLRTISTPPSTTSPLQISSIATNSSKMADFSLKRTLHQSRSSPSSKVHPCLYCSKTCSSTSNLKEHMRSHTGERPFSCDVCHKKFAQKSTLSKHTQIHTRFKRFSPVGITMQESSCVYNLDSAEPTPINSLKPPLSLVEHSSSANQLKIKHISNVSMDPKHATLKSSTNWDSHKINADVCDSFNLNDIKPIISFESDRPDVTQSLEIVSNPSSSHYHPLASSIYPLPQSSDNVFTCKPILTKANPIKSPVSDAVSDISISNKPYTCDMCDRTFTTSGNLKEHRRTHTGERPFECPFCEKTFVQASTRSRHVKNHSKHFVN